MTEFDFVYDQAVILRIPQASEMGDEDCLARIAAFESAVLTHLPPQSGVDGHEIGDSEALVYIYGPDADLIYPSIKNTLSEFFAGNGAQITLQYGLPQDPNTKERVINL